MCYGTVMELLPMNNKRRMRRKLRKEFGNFNMEINFGKPTVGGSTPEGSCFPEAPPSIESIKFSCNFQANELTQDVFIEPEMPPRRQERRIPSSQPQNFLEALFQPEECQMLEGYEDWSDF